ncbi:Acetyltransferase (GNAT) family protein [Actinacidiphila rubida]|uniref:Acetyltransferase (GNAT) family protein n=2 Tax=Actinacidiphila rubida TaxID=310780 RepID=A0A1H8GRD1_9ACTN|nr:Acetyltransferase (GNAT) family protein [Actinacidiphila rubida]
MLAHAVRTWVAGWAVSRRTPPPVEKPWGLYVDVAGNPAEVGRHVLPETEESLVRRAAASVTAPRTWMKMPAEPGGIEAWMPPDWAVAWDRTGHLMATDLTPTAPRTPGGYAVAVDHRDGVVHVRVRDAAGRPAARGQAAIVGDAAVVDQVVTEEAHRRLGLGRVVMRTLADQAVDRGAGTGILVATDAGRALYETLGWKKHATLAECIYRP